MSLDDAQKKSVAAWMAEGLKLSEIQSRIAAEFGISLTYMQVRLLVDDLKLTPKDVEGREPTAPTLSKSSAGPGSGNSTRPGLNSSSSNPTTREPAASPAGVSVLVDQITRPGAVVSGKVTFSDGEKADWYFDQSGRLGLIAQNAGYRPAPADLQEFRTALESELSNMGL
jgi:hypothetical protein